MQKKILFKNGFSLVELLTVISIMTVLFGFGYSNYRDFQRRQHLESAVRMIKSDLRLAQEMALAGRKPSDCVGDLEGYEFQLSSINSGWSSQYELRTLCASSNVDYKIVDLPEGTEIRVFGVTNGFHFLPLGQGINRLTLTLRVRFDDADIDPRRIVISEIGEIYDEN